MQGDLLLSDEFCSKTGLHRYQLVGIACLRAAMKHNQIKLPAKAPVIEGTPVKDALDPARFVYISDKTYTVDEVSLDLVAELLESTDRSQLKGLLDLL